MFKPQRVSLEATHAFDKIVCDYVSGKLPHSFFEHDYSLKAFGSIMDQRKFDDEQRRTLNQILKKQYSNLPAEGGSLVEKNIDLLLEPGTFTVTTGHQLNLLTGPLYFVYKILTTIKLAENLKAAYPSNNFVPVYWMATEDHDFEEIRSVNIFGNKIEWKQQFSIATGRIPTKDIEQFTEQVITLFGTSAERGREIADLVKNSYVQSKTLAQATRYLAHALFKKYGLVILDADEAAFKDQFRKVITDDVFNQTANKIVSDTNAALEKNYSVQVNPREINFFYLGDDYRERIVKNDTGFEINNKDKRFSAEEMKAEIENHPERFSPNVLLRPVYQETILPNLAYIGGPAEVHYWLQLKNLFNHYHIPYPMVVLRNCMMILEEDVIKKLDKLSLSPSQIFEPADKIISDYIKAHASNELSLNGLAVRMEEVFNDINARASVIDVTLKNTVEAEKQKALNALKNIEGKMLRAEKQKHEAVTNQVKKLKEKLFPANTLQERYENIFPYLLKYGKEFIDELYKNCEALPTEFIMLKQGN